MRTTHKPELHRPVRLSAFALVLVTILASAITGESRADVAGIQGLRQALVSYRSRDLQAARGRLKDVIRDPNLTDAGAEAQINAQALNLLGLVELAGPERRLDRAERCFAWAMFQDPDELTYWQNYVETRATRQGYSLFSRELAAGAVTSYDQSSIFKSRSTTGRSLIAVPFARGIGSNGARLLLRTLLSIKQGDMHDAGRFVAEVRDLQPVSCLTSQGLAAVALAHLELDSARVHAARAMEQCDNVSSARFMVGHALWLDGKPEEAIEWVESAAVLDGTNETAARALTDLRRTIAPSTSERIAGLTRAIAEDPNGWSPWAALWRERSQQADRGREEFRVFASHQKTLHANASAPRAAVALELLAQGRLQVADEELQEAISLERPFEEFLLARLAIAVLRHDPVLARKALAVVGRVAPDLQSDLSRRAIDASRFPGEAPLTCNQVTSGLDVLSRAFPEMCFVGVAFEALAADPVCGRERDALVLRSIQDLRTAGSETREALKVHSARFDRLLARHAELVTKVQGMDEWTQKEVASLRQEDERLYAFVVDFKQEVASIAQELAAQQHRLAKRLNDQDARTVAVLDELNSRIRGHDAELVRLGMQQAELVALTQGSAEARARGVSKLSNYISIGPSFGWFQFNLIPLFEALLRG